MPSSDRLLLEAAVGDPFIGVIARGIAPLAGRIAGRVGSAFRGARAVPAGFPFKGALPSLPGAGRTISRVGRAVGGGAAAGVGIELAARGVRRAMGPEVGMPRRRRRMNPANIRALRKALSRVRGFEKIARKVIKVTSPRTEARVAFKRKRRN